MNCKQYIGLVLGIDNIVVFNIQKHPSRKLKGSEEIDLNIIKIKVHILKNEVQLITLIKKQA